MIINKKLACEYAESVKREMDIVTAREMIRIVAQKAKNLPLTASKFGGLPYLPKDTQIPTNSKGEQLSLLAQINCSELPTNDIYPKNGMLQFWILCHWSYGVDYDGTLTHQDNFRVIYYPEIGEYESSERLAEMYQPYKEDKKEIFDGNAEFALNFKLKKQGITPSDYRFEETFIKIWNSKFPDYALSEQNGSYVRLPDDVITVLHQGEEDDKHQIGGYPYFTQDDPRYDDSMKYDTLLLQISSQFNEDAREWEICWGDVGVLNFFIEPEKLKNSDFSDVFYTMDCC